MLAAVEDFLLLILLLLLLLLLPISLFGRGSTVALGDFAFRGFPTRFDLYWVVIQVSTNRS